MSTRSEPVLFTLTEVNPALRSEKAGATFRARVRSEATIDREAFVRKMAEHCHRDKNECNYFLDVAQEVALEFMRQGCRVQTGLVELGLSIKGTFDSVDAEFDPSVHTVCPTLTASKKLKAAAAAVPVRNVAEHLAKPRLLALMDVETKRMNEIVAGHELHLQGRNVAINPEHADEGVFLMDAAGHTVAKAAVLASDAQTVSCRFDAAPASGTYDLHLVCRNGAGVQFKPGEATLHDVAVGC